MAKSFALNHSLLLLSLLILLVSVFLCTVIITKPQAKNERFPSSEKEAETDMATSTEIFGVKIVKNPPQSKLDELEVTTWSKYSGQPGKMPWEFEATETMYLLKGKVKVTVDGHEEAFEIGAGDLVVFPKGMKITWDVIDAVEKHYSLEK